MSDPLIPGIDAVALQRLLDTALGRQSQKAFAEKAQINEALLSQMMTGHFRSKPSISTLRKIANASQGRVQLNELLAAAGRPVIAEHQFRQMERLEAYAQEFQNLQKLPSPAEKDTSALLGYALPSAFLRQLKERELPYTIFTIPFMREFSHLQENAPYSSDLYMEVEGYDVKKWFIYTHYMGGPEDYAPGLTAFLARSAFLGDRDQLLTLVTNDPGFLPWLPPMHLQTTCALSVIIMDLDDDQIARHRVLTTVSAQLLPLSSSC